MYTNTSLFYSFWINSHLQTYYCVYTLFFFSKHNCIIYTFKDMSLFTNRVMIESDWQEKNTPNPPKKCSKKSVCPPFRAPCKMSKDLISTTLANLWNMLGLAISCLMLLISDWLIEGCGSMFSSKIHLHGLLFILHLANLYGINRFIMATHVHTFIHKHLKNM